MTHIAARWGGTAAIVAGVAWFVGLSYMTLDELEYQGWIASSPMPDALGMGAYIVAGIALALALISLRPLLQGPGAGVGRGIATAGAALALIPLWPATFLAPVLAGIGLFVLALASLRSDDFKTGGSRVHAYGLPGAVLTGITLGAVGVTSPALPLLYAAALTGGLIWIGIDMNAVRKGQPEAIGAMA
ncbi:MAG: hypothetical protein M3N53_03300 [Actinomycetota bacterium]|nr:hypothetical protein [Actinomycetota bacterium]